VSDIFVSYSSRDRGRIGPLVHALEKLGWSVFWDNAVPPGLTWDEFIGRELEKTRSVVVAWSEESIKSDWVREEARSGKRREVLIPLLLEPVEPPFGFGGIQAVSLIDSDWDAHARAIAGLVTGLTRILGEPPGQEQVENQENDLSRQPTSKGTRTEEKKSPTKGTTQSTIYVSPEGLNLDGLWESHEAAKETSAKRADEPSRTEDEDERISSRFLIADRTLRGGNYSANKGDVIEVPADEAVQLIEAGAAHEATLKMRLPTGEALLYTRARTTSNSWVLEAWPQERELARTRVSVRCEGHIVKSSFRVGKHRFGEPKNLSASSVGILFSDPLLSPDGPRLEISITGGGLQPPELAPWDTG